MLEKEYKVIEEFIKLKNYSAAKKNLYRILKISPLDSKANEMLGYIVGNEGDLIKAHHLLLTSNMDKNASIEARYYLGISYIRQNNIEKGIEYIKNALKLNGDFYEGLVELALCYIKIGNFSEAENVYKKIINHYPDNSFVPLINIGKLKSEQKKYNCAIKYFESALEKKPNSEIALINKANALFDLCYFDKSLEVLYNIIEINNNNKQAILNISSNLNKLARYSESIIWSKKILCEEINNELAIINLAESLVGKRKLKYAITILNKINENSIYYNNALNNKGLIYLELRNYENAINCFDDILNRDKNNINALINKAKTLQEILRYDEALININKALLIDNGSSNAHLLKALTLFNLNDFKNAWEEYEWRNKNSIKESIFKINKWNMELFNNLNLLIWGEQGLGDQILYGSIINELIKLEINITILYDEKLVGLFQNSFPQIKFIYNLEDLDISLFDFQISIVSVQKYFRHSINDFNKIIIPYLKNLNIEKNKIEDSKKILCGISWKSYNNEGAKDKSLSLKDFDKILELQSIKFIDIQYYPQNISKNENEYNRKINIIEGINFYEDFDSLVNIIDQCEIIITCSNTTAHIAGAMGKKTYLLLPKFRGRHWYWKKDLDRKSIIYKTITILEQSEHGNWENPLEELRNILKFI